MSHPQRRLTKNQRNAVRRAFERGDLGQARSRYRRYVGQQIEKEFKRLVDADPTLKGKVRTTLNGKGGPDVVGEGSNKGQWWDLTTEKDWKRGRHQEKYEPTHGKDYDGIFW